MSVCISSGAKQILSEMLSGFADKFPEKKIFLGELRSKVEDMPICTGVRKPRALSNWQLCIKEKREGKKFDPTAMKSLTKEYKTGTCPSKEYLEKHKAA